MGSSAEKTGDTDLNMRRIVARKAAAPRAWFIHAIGKRLEGQMELLGVGFFVCNYASLDAKGKRSLFECHIIMYAQSGCAFIFIIY